MPRASINPQAAAALPVQAVPEAEDVQNGVPLHKVSALQSEDRLAALRLVLEEKLVKRKVSLKILDFGKVEEASKGRARQTVTLVMGINDTKAKEIGKFIKELPLKGIQHQIQGDQLRVNGKKRDDLQDVIALLKGADLGIPLQFENFRD